MDLSQTKLSKSEWNSVEIPVADSEKRVLSLILEGYKTPDIRTNKHLSLLSFMKVEQSEEMEYYLYTTHFQDTIERLKIPATGTQVKKPKQPNKADMIRIQNLTNNVSGQRQSIFDFLMLDYLVEASKGKTVALYTLIKFRSLSIRGINRYLLKAVDAFLSAADTTSTKALQDVFHNAPTYIERNKALMEYDDDALYSHQRDLFRVFSDPRTRTTPKCVLYMAPTGTGKTLSPIGLSQDYRVIFVCAARHVGLALAKSAISVGKRVAFAFGCETSSDIRLHYFAAADFTVNKRSGGIKKVDNSNGTRVEIMICDVASYLVAMYYMKVFHHERDIITYWDEPTISMDHETDQATEELQSLHDLIHRVWSKNQISKIVLSCATLPKPDEIGAALQDFKAKFSLIDGEHRDPEIRVIDSHDCKKTISLLQKDGKIALPHLLFSDYKTLVMDCVEHCVKNRSLLRYFDVQEIVRFVEHVQPFLREDARIERRFSRIDEITLYSVKVYYLDTIRALTAEQWPAIHKYMCQSLHPRFKNDGLDLRKIKSVQPEPVGMGSGGGVPFCLRDSSGITPENVASPNIVPRSGGAPITRQSSMAQNPLPLHTPPLSKPDPAAGILLSTADAHTLTDGPTIYLAEDVEKVGRFYIQQTKIPDSIFSTIQQKIEKNNLIQKQIRKLEQEMEATLGTAGSENDKDSKKVAKEPASKDAQRLLEQIGGLREAIQTVHLNSMYIPNTRQHQECWVQGSPVPNAFVPNVDEEDVRQIMVLEVDNQRKLLLILGIGVFGAQQHTTSQSETQYKEIMKRLAYNQRLFLIIASSDYIYGTNYQFCHGFIGKDLTNMTQQKTIQAIGRVGRNNIQQEYTVRFRDDGVLKQLFKRSTENREAATMNRLFCSDDE